MSSLAYIYNQKGDIKTAKLYAKMMVRLNMADGTTKVGIYNYKTNIVKALDYYRVAMLLGDSCAAHNIGHYYFVIKKDYDLALKHYLLALEYNNYRTFNDIFSTYTQIIYIYKSKSDPIFLDYYHACIKLGHMPLILNYVRYLYDIKAYGDMLFIFHYAIVLANRRKKDIVGISDICNIVSVYYCNKASYVKDLYYKLLSIRYDSYIKDADAFKKRAMAYFDLSSNSNVKTDLTNKFSKYAALNKYAIIIKYLITCYNLCEHKHGLFTCTAPCDPTMYVDDLCGLDPKSKYAPIAHASIKKFVEYYRKRSGNEICCFVDKWIDRGDPVLIEYISQCDDYEFILKYKRYLPDEKVKQLDFFAELYPLLSSDMIECSICFDDKILATTNCKHQMCLQCLYKLVKCPFCRSKLVTLKS